MRFIKTKRRLCFFAVFSLLGSTTVDAEGVQSNDYQPQGWFFYRDPELLLPPKEKEKEKKEPQNITVTPPENENEKEPVANVEINSEWLRVNLPKLLDAAQDHPTKENVRRYLYAQRIAMDKATVFAEIYSEVARTELALSEELRRPTNNSQLMVYDRSVLANKREVFKNTNATFGLFFFFTSDCEYCISMIAEIRDIKRKFDIDILPVSLNGQPLPGASDLVSDTVYDDGTLTSMMPVEVTPTIYALNKETLNAAVISKGYINDDELADLSLLAMRDLGVIDESTYQKSQSVKDILLVPADPNEKMMINEEELYRDSNYLTDMLREKFTERYMTKDSFIPGVIAPYDNELNDEVK